jgi:hypothetical protein
MLRKIWRDPVWSTVFGGLILSAVTAFGAYVFGYWEALKGKIFLVYDYMCSSSNAPVWWVSFSSLFVVVTILIVIYRASKSRKYETQEENWRSYLQDTFWGLEWHWSYLGNSIDRLNVLCPKCKYQIAEDRNVYSYNSVSYKCEDCGYQARVDAESNYDVERKVRLKIQQKLRTGAWSEN